MEETKLFFDAIGFPLYSRYFYETALLEKFDKEDFVEKKELLQGNNFTLSFDETTINGSVDCLAIDAAILSSKNFHKKSLINLQEIDGKDTDVISDAIITVLEQNYGLSEKMTNFKVLISDGPTVNKSIGRVLKERYGITHVICLCHNLHNLSEKFISTSPIIKEILQKIENKWSRSPYFRKAWKNTLIYGAFPSYVITRWGTWLNSEQYEDELIKNQLNDEFVKLQQAEKIQIITTYLENDGLTLGK